MADPKGHASSVDIPISQSSDSDSDLISSSERPEHGSYDDHPFSEPATAQYWARKYEAALYEGRHRYDPNYTWTAEEERKLVRKVSRVVMEKETALTLSCIA